EDREDAALARLAPQRDLSAQQADELSADRKPQPCTAVLAAGRAVALREGFEDRPLHVVGDPDPGVGDAQRHHAIRGRQALAAPAGRHRRGTELDLAPFSEPESVAE